MNCGTDLFVTLIWFLQLFYSFFKTLVGKEIIVELKNDLAIRGMFECVFGLELMLPNCRRVAQRRPILEHQVEGYQGFGRR